MYIKHHPQNFTKAHYKIYLIEATWFESLQLLFIKLLGYNVKNVQSGLKPVPAHCPLINPFWEVWVLKV